VIVVEQAVVWWRFDAKEGPVQYGEVLICLLRLSKTVLVMETITSS
jgi:hypothetical protein